MISFVSFRIFRSIRFFSYQQPGAEVIRTPSSLSNTHTVQSIVQSVKTLTESSGSDKKCGTSGPNDGVPDMVNVQNAVTGEILGPPGPEPTRYSDWSFKGKCVDF